MVIALRESVNEGNIHLGHICCAESVTTEIGHVFGRTSNLIRLTHLHLCLLRLFSFPINVSPSQFIPILSSVYHRFIST